MMVLLAVLIVLVTVDIVIGLRNGARQPDLVQHLSSQRQELTLSLQAFGSAQQQQLQQLTVQTAKQLEQMRAVVDEKLQTSLERRLSESFKQVSERLEAVYRGLGEMQTLATGVGDLRRMLTNVKVRGTWGEVQLDNLLSQFLTSGDYAHNVATKPNSRERVEFVINLPNKTDESKFLLLPIDAKFPLEDYERLQQAQEAGQREAVEAARAALAARLKKEAHDIASKYVNPPVTTDFAILYLPLESLYAEIVANTTLVNQLQTDYRVSVMGPNTISAFLSSLQLGFRTLTIEKRSSEVWALLGKIIYLCW